MSRLNLYYVIGFIFLLKLLILAGDHTIYFLMGDSGSYLASAITRWAPWDRSFTYGLWIRLLTKHVNSLQFVVFCQTLLSAGAAALVCVILNRAVAVRLSIAALCGVLCAIEPLQLLSERLILTEATSTFLFALLVTLALFYLKRPAIWLLVAIPLVSMYLVSLRVSYLPAVLSTMIVPFFRWPSSFSYGNVEKRRLLQIGSHIVLLGALTAFAFHRYEIWYGKAAEIPPTLNGAGGFFLISQVAPILEASDFPDPAFGAKVLRATTLDRHVMINRQGQGFAPNGIVQVLTQLASPKLTMAGIARANDIAQFAAKHAVLHHPWEFADLVRYNILDYFNLNDLKPTIAWDEYRDSAIDASYQPLLAHYGINITRQPPPGPVMDWHYHAELWYMFLIVFPLIPTVCLLIPQFPCKRQLALLAIYVWGQWAVCTILVQHDTPRYETGMAWLFFPVAGLIASEIAAIRERKLPATTEERTSFRATGPTRLSKIASS